MPGWGSSLIGFFNHSQGLILTGALVLGLALLLLIATLNAFVGGGRRSRNSALRRRLSAMGFFTRLLAIGVLAFFATTVLFAGWALHTYEVFTHEELAGRLECLRQEAANQVLIVRFTPMRQGQPGQPQTFTLYGDQWEVGAHIVKWTPRTIQFGFHTAYRLTQIKGSYQQVEDENRRPHQAYPLTPGSDWIWSLLTRYGRYLPFIEAVYGNAVSNSARTGEVFDIYVTTSGLSTKPH